MSILLLSEPGVNVYALTFREYIELRTAPAPQDCRCAFVETSDESFGYPIYLPRWFQFVYHASRKFNVEAPQLPDKAPSIQDVMPNHDEWLVRSFNNFYAEATPNMRIAMKALKPGWSSTYWLGLAPQYFDKLDPAAKTCTSWKRQMRRLRSGGIALAEVSDAFEGELDPHHGIDFNDEAAGSRIEIWIHPTENRELTMAEVSAISGQPLEHCTLERICDQYWLYPPPKVIEWLQRQVGFYAQAAWGEQDWESTYNPKTCKFDGSTKTVGAKFFKYRSYVRAK